MPNNRAEREKEVRDRYDFVVCGGEYSIAHALLAVADAIITGGNFTYEFLKSEAAQFGIDLASELARAGLDPTKETLYFDYFIFENWEIISPKRRIAGKTIPEVRLPLPNKFVPYIAARRKANATTTPQIARMMGGRAGVVGAGSGVLYLRRTNGNLMWYSHQGWDSGEDQWASGGQGVRVGTAWGRYTGIFAGGRGVLYGLCADGKLMWYKHAGWTNGADQWDRNGQGVAVGAGWHQFTSVIAGGDGVLYGITPDGKLMWYNHLGFNTGADEWANNGKGIEISHGWHEFLGVAAAGDGTLYAIEPDGKLLWYKHMGFSTGARSWEHGAGLTIGTGWHLSTDLVSGYHGILYQLHRDGKLTWYKHLGWNTGADQWAKNGQAVHVGNGWVQG